MKNDISLPKISVWRFCSRTERRI